MQRQRQARPQRVAQVLETLFVEITNTETEVLARHDTEAGLPAEAMPHWRRAGEFALQGSAHQEAIEYVTKELDLLATLSDTSARRLHELDLQILLGPSLMATKGQAAPEVQRVYIRAKSGDLTACAPAPYYGSVWIGYLLVTDLV